MKRPNLLTASIGDILTWSATHNGKVKSAKLQEFIASVLSRASYLDRVKEMRWSANKWADRAWNDMQAIGVTETLELNPAKPPASAYMYSVADEGALRILGSLLLPIQRSPNHHAKAGDDSRQGNARNRVLS